jgi:hypothetical protein
MADFFRRDPITRIRQAASEKVVPALTGVNFFRVLV